jgi:hypothetical protein
MGDLGKLLMAVGIFLTLLGALITLLSKFPLPLGNLPGDIKIERDNFTFYFPIASSILISLILTALLNIALVLFGKK